MRLAARLHRQSHALQPQYCHFLYAGFVLGGDRGSVARADLTLWLSRVLRPVLWVRPVEGTLAADSLIQGPRRTSGTVAALMLSLALVIALGGVARSSLRFAFGVDAKRAQPRLVRHHGANLTARSFVFPASLGDGLRPDTGGRRSSVGPQLSACGKGWAGDAGGLDVAFRRTPRETAAGRGRFRLRCTGARNRSKARAGLGEFRAITWRQAGRNPGDSVPCRHLRLPIAGIVRDFSDQQGSLLISPRPIFAAWHDDSVNVFRFYLEPGPGNVLR